MGWESVCRDLRNAVVDHSLLPDSTSSQATVATLQYFWSTFYFLNDRINVFPEKLFQSTKGLLHWNIPCRHFLSGIVHRFVGFLQHPYPWASILARKLESTNRDVFPESRIASFRFYHHLRIFSFRNRTERRTYYTPWDISLKCALRHKNDVHHIAKPVVCHVALFVVILMFDKVPSWTKLACKKFAPHQEMKYVYRPHLLFPIILKSARLGGISATDVHYCYVVLENCSKTVSQYVCRFENRSQLPERYWTAGEAGMFPIPCTYLCSTHNPPRNVSYLHSSCLNGLSPSCASRDGAIVKIPSIHPTTTGSVYHGQCGPL